MQGGALGGESGRGDKCPPARRMGIDTPSSPASSRRRIAMRLPPSPHKPHHTTAGAETPQLCPSASLGALSTLRESLNTRCAGAEDTPTARLRPTPVKKQSTVLLNLNFPVGNGVVVVVGGFGWAVVGLVGIDRMQATVLFDRCLQPGASREG